jgi:hypothetical protein
MGLGLPICAAFQAPSKSACRNLNGPLTVSDQAPYWETGRWLCVRLIGRALLALAGAFAIPVSRSFAQQTSQGPVDPGLSFETVGPVADVIGTYFGYVLLVLASIWQYLMDHAPAAALLGVGVALAIALRTLAHQRATARLRETFAMIHSSIWSDDYSQARRTVRGLEDELQRTGGTIADFYKRKSSAPAYPHGLFSVSSRADADHAARVSTLRRVLSNYENMALGVKTGILDEGYLFRWTRGILLRDWDLLAPLVAQIRHDSGNQHVYIEFEGLAVAWENERSYFSGRQMERARRRVTVD